MKFDKDKHIAFKGKAFCIEWYVEASGYCQPLEFSEQMPKDRVAKLAQFFKIMGDVGAIRNKTKIRHEGEQIYAFKPQPYRFLCFFAQGRKIIITNGFNKKVDKLPWAEKDRALEKRADYFARIKAGEYYG